MRERKMLGRIIMFIVLLVFVTIFTAMDISNLHNGIGGYIQNPPGMLVSVTGLSAIPMLVFNLKAIGGLRLAMVLDVIYISFYTWIYFKIKEERNNSKK